MEHDAHARGVMNAPSGDPQRDPLRGRLLDGRYRIGARIARGGMASVHEALDVRLDRPVAVKIMHAGLGDDHDFAERFVREARAAARLSHPNVVAVYDQGDDDGVVFLAMELVPGHTLRDTISKESPMAPSKAMAVMEPVLSALASAHRAGLIHRDVKPENVLIATDPATGASRVKVADFGLAKAVSADTQHTATQGVLIGTVSYLAPELVIDGRADARADVYAAGVVLYELLTGVKPHEGETPIQVAYKHVHHDVPPPSALVPDLPPYVDALVARATARDRELRPRDAAVMLHHLHRVSHALADGVRDDPELTIDLTPLAPRGEVGTGTAPELWDDSEMSALLEPAVPPPALREHTSTMPVSPPPVETYVIAPAPPVRRPPRQRRSRRGPALLVLALGVALALGSGAFWFGWARYSPAPSVVGLDRAEAQAELQDADLEIEFGDAVYDSDTAKGVVVDADPSGGSRVLSGDTVRLTLSLGPLLVPKLRGLTEDQAQDTLVTNQLEFGRSIGRFSEKVPEGTVLGSSPKPGTEVSTGKAVDLLLSKGRRPLSVGSWVGKDIDKARKVLDRRGLVVDVTEEYDDDVDAGAVISQDPPDGTLFRGDHVRLTVSNGPELVEVPSVRAEGVTAATEELRAAGFDVDVRENPDFYAGLGFAARTDPEASTMAPKGSTIILYVI